MGQMRADSERISQVAGEKMREGNSTMSTGRHIVVVFSPSSTNVLAASIRSPI
jgi:hypothetical protein